MKTNTKYKKLNAKKIIVYAVVTVLFILGLFVVGELTNVTNLHSRTTQTTADHEDKINYGPPTDQERQAGDEQKQVITDRQDDKPQAPVNTAAVVVTGAAQYDGVIEVTAYISNVYKDGTCTFKFEQAANVVTKNTIAYRDVSTTICTNPLVPRSEFPGSGDWKVTVSYASSDGVSGQSEPKTMKVE